MNKKLKKLSEEALAHWIENLELVENGEFDSFCIGPQRCSYCHKFWMYADAGDECFGCPVAEVVGERYCDNTPYHQVYVLVRQIEAGQSVDHVDLKRAIEAEILFLEGIDEKIKNGEVG